MPPQSRGLPNTFGHTLLKSSTTDNHGPEVHHGNLDAPKKSQQVKRTPSPVNQTAEESEQSAPIRPHFALCTDEKDEDQEEEEEEEEEEEQDSLDDEEFESHYSRQDSPASSEVDDDDEEEEDEDGEDVVEMSPTRSRAVANGGVIQRVSSLPSSVSNSNQTTHLHVSHSTTSLPRAAPPLPPPLYPPFYNRPPTPLPPSPSLTSLLRPPSLLNRSTTSTRPTTPDSSDIETPATNDDTEAAVASSARRAHPLPPTAPKVPTYEYYGFVLYLASSLAFFLYLMWAYLPSPFLHAMGITYYPNRWWALAVPAWIVMLLVYIYIALACWNTEYLTLGLEKIETMVDEAGNVAIIDDQGQIRKGGSKRYLTDVEEKRRKDKPGGTSSRKKASGGGHHGGSGRRKERRKKERDRDKDDDWMFGYTGSMVAGRLANGVTWHQIWNEGTDGVMDVPIGGVCEVLYGQGQSGEY